jgi:hypothetical protein
LTVRVVGVSGPDGAGKSTLVAEVRRRAEQRGGSVRTVYLYGCVACRRARTRPAAPGSREEEPSAIFSLLRNTHALLDGFELAVRLVLASGAIGRRRRTGPRLILTDRSPLDGLAKHDPSPRSPAARLYIGLARRYQRIFLLDASADVLAERDAEHPERELDRWRVRFLRWAARVDETMRIDSASRSTPELAEQILRLLELPEQGRLPRRRPQGLGRR